jgi:hypothetical protein
MGGPMVASSSGKLLLLISGPLLDAWLRLEMMGAQQI